MTNPSNPARSQRPVHLSWVLIVALVSVAAAYLGWMGVRTLSIPTARDWVVREPGLATASVLPVSGRTYMLSPVHDAAGTSPVIRVPRILVQELPDALTEMENVDARKRLFVRTVLPLVLEMNRLVRRDRARLLSIRERMETGKSLAVPDQRWLQALANEYGLEETDIDTLLKRVDTVPPSLALAQAANESAWGQSRFAQNGNALFGQWSWDGNGIVPHKRPDGEKYRVRKFPTLLSSVYAYMRNLNTHPAYKRFRNLRAELKTEETKAKGLALAGTLERYSERRGEYVAELRQMIRTNDFQRFNNAVLVEPPALFAFGPGMPPETPVAQAEETASRGEEG